MTERDELIDEFKYYKKQMQRSLPLNELKTYDIRIRIIRQEFKEKFEITIEEAIRGSDEPDFIS